MTTAMLLDESKSLFNIAYKMGLDDHFVLSDKMVIHYKDFDNFEDSISYYRILKERDTNINFGMNINATAFIEYRNYMIYLFSGNRRSKILGAIKNNKDFLIIQGAALT